MRSEAHCRNLIGRFGLLAALLLVTPLHAQTNAASSTPIDSVERADEVLRDVGRQRAAIVTQFAKDQEACSSVFFMTHCLDAARERRRVALARLRDPEIDANAFKRRARVADRDKVLEEKRAKAEQEATPEQRGLTIREPRKSGNAAQENTPASGNAHTARPPLVERPERGTPPHKPKPLTAEITPAAEARNIAAFDRKAAESAERQRSIAAKKAEKEKDRAAKKARAAAESAPAAVPAP